MWRLLLGTMGVKSLVQGLNAAATAGFEPRTVWSEVRRRNRLATVPPLFVELAMSKHERRAPRQSQLKLKVKGKDSAVQMARTDVVLAPKQQLPPQMARTGVLSPVGADQRRPATPTACATSAEMALGLRQTSHSAGHWRFLPPPPFFFCGCWCKLFSTPPSSN